MSVTIFLLLIATALSEKIGDSSKYDEDSISATSVIVDEAENEVDQRGSRYRGSFTYNDKNAEDDGSYDGTWIDTIPGKSGQDFPSYAEIPKTSFTCKGKRASGYFADIETDCQVFHICMDEVQKISFLCPNGSIFNQKVLICDWWYNVDCQSSVAYLDVYNEGSKNEELHKQQEFIFDNFALEEIYDLNLASSGGNQAPTHTTENNIDVVINNADDRKYDKGNRRSNNADKNKSKENKNN